jgi:CheY-like chemotaxis protein
MSKVLLVDDDKYLNKLLNDRLSLEGFQVVSVLDGESAWKQLSQARDSSPFDVLLLDMLLPRTMGAELLTQIRESELFPELKIHAMSGVYKSAQEIKEISELHGLKGYWTKPFRADDLISQLGNQQLKVSGSSHLRGDLKTLSFERILMNAYDSLFTGALVISMGLAQRRIYFSNGFPVSADSTIMGEGFGASLVLQGKITEDQREEVSRRMVEEQCQFGQMLTKMGLLSPDEIFDGLRRCSQRVILNVFTLKEGDFEFQPLENLPQHIIHIEFNPILLILRAHKTLYPADFLNALYLTKTDSYPHRSQRFFQVLPLCNLDTESMSFFRDLPPDQTLAETMSKISANKTENLFRVLFAMESIGVLEWKHQEAPQIKRLDSLDFAEAFERQKSSSTDITKRLRAQYIELIGKNFYEMLDVSIDANEQEIKEAYRHRRFELHPDRFGAELGGEAKRILDDMLARIDQAYQLLSHTDEREAYQAHVTDSRRDSALESKKFLEAQNIARQAMAFLDKSDFKSAKEMFQKASAIWNKSSEYPSYSLYCDFRIALADNDQQSAERALQSLRQLMKGAQASETGLILLAQVFRLQGSTDLARDTYLRVLRLNPESQSAADALSSLGVQMQSKEQQVQFNRQSKKRLRAATFALLLLGSASAFYWAKTNLGQGEEGQILSGNTTRNIIPSLEIRVKEKEAKIFTEDGWSKDLPDPVLRSKCFQFVKEASRLHGINRIQIYDSKRLIAFCSSNTFRKFGERK